MDDRSPAGAGAARTSRRSRNGRIAVGLLVPLAVATPALVVRATGIHVTAPVAALLFAAAVVAAAFLLTWGTELAELDIGQGLALALLALIAVLPEYAVDVIFAWKAGQDPDTYAPLALANMTGANRLLIGVGWSVVALAAIVAARRASYAGRDVEPPTGGRPAAVRLHEVQVVEVAFLALASAYALTLPLRRSITMVDTLILVAIFVAYLWRVRRADSAEDEEDEKDEASELFGPAAAIAGLPARVRRLFTVGMLAVAAGIILVVAEPFAESLEETGQELGVSEFLLVQWVAPLASETPEFIAVLLMAYKLAASAALGALVSSKINQWTLLVGILPLVFALSAGSWRGLPVDAVQREELLLTAAQSAFAVALVVSGRLTTRGAWALLGLFTAQFVLAWTLPEGAKGVERLVLSGVYLALAAALLVARRAALASVLRTGILGRAGARSGRPPGASGREP